MNDQLLTQEEAVAAAAAAAAGTVGKKTTTTLITEAEAAVVVGSVLVQDHLLSSDEKDQQQQQQQQRRHENNYNRKNNTNDDDNTTVTNSVTVGTEYDDDCSSAIPSTPTSSRRVFGVVRIGHSFNSNNNNNKVEEEEDQQTPQDYPIDEQHQQLQYCYHQYEKPPLTPVSPPDSDTGTDSPPLVTSDSSPLLLHDVNNYNSKNSNNSDDDDDNNNNNNKLNNNNDDTVIGSMLDDEDDVVVDVPLPSSNGDGQEPPVVVDDAILCNLKPSVSRVEEELVTVAIPNDDVEEDEKDIMDPPSLSGKRNTVTNNFFDDEMNAIKEREKAAKKQLSLASATGDVVTAPIVTPSHQVSQEEEMVAMVEEDYHRRESGTTTAGTTSTGTVPDTPSVNEYNRGQLSLASGAGEVLVIAPMFVSSIDNNQEVNNDDDVVVTVADPPSQQPGAYHSTSTTEDDRTKQKQATSTPPRKRLIVDRNIVSNESMVTGTPLASLADADLPDDDDEVRAMSFAAGSTTASSTDITAQSSSPKNMKKVRTSRGGYSKMSTTSNESLEGGSSSIKDAKNSKGFGRKQVDRATVEDPLSNTTSIVGRNDNDENGNVVGRQEDNSKPMHIGAYSIRPSTRRADDRPNDDLDPDFSGTSREYLAQKSSRSIKSTNSFNTATSSLKQSPSMNPPQQQQPREEQPSAAGLVVAVPIDDENDDVENPRKGKNRPHAVEKDPNEKKPNILRSRKVQIGIVVAVITFVAILVTVLLTVKGDPVVVEVTTPSPTSAPTTFRTMEYLRFFLSVVDPSTDVFDMDSPANMAADWIINEDSQQLELTSPRLVQRFTLALFYFSTTANGESPWNLCNPPFVDGGSNFCPEVAWLTDADECTWNGVTCNSTVAGEVSDINLGGLGLSGGLPVDLSLLTSMKQLDLDRNQLTGPIPPQYAASFSQLEVLKLVENELTGETSLNFFDIVSDSVREIYLRNNTFTGTVSTHIGRLTNLQVLWLGGNNFEGTMPTEIGNLAAMISLDVEGNELTGTLPTELGRLTNAERVFFAAQFSGTIPTELAGMTNLEWLFLRENGLSGTIPNIIYNMTHLQRLQLQDNKLTGTLSTLVGQMTNLDDLRVSRNELTGTIPSEIQNLSKLSLAWFQLNEFTGSVPTEICSLTTTTLEFMNADCYEVLGEIPNPCLCCTSCCERETEFCKDV